MDTRSEIAWLARRAGWGLGPGELDDLTSTGTSVFLDRLTDPDAAGVVASPSPWDGFKYDPEGDQPAQNLEAGTRWINHLRTGPRPFEDLLAWFWHDHFAVSAEVISSLTAMIVHLELLQSTAMGNFDDMMRKVTVDAGMLVFLDGATSTGESPNENYGRELQELYTLGIGNYTEDDVRAAAVALTGYVVRKRFGWSVVYRKDRHDDTPQTLLGVKGVHDVDTVLDAVMAHPAVPVRIARKLSSFILGTTEASLVDELAAGFADASLEIAPLGRAVLEAGLDGRGHPLVMAPVPWLVQILRATGATIEPRIIFLMLGSMGQVPGVPPNVGGYPGTSAWLSSTATAARFSSAGYLAEQTPDDSPVLAAAASGDWGGLADLLLRPGGFSQPTIDALGGLSRNDGPRPGVGRLALALSSPDMLIA